jgi:hypothetical protein
MTKRTGWPLKAVTFYGLFTERLTSCWDADVRRCAGSESDDRVVNVMHEKNASHLMWLGSNYVYFISNIDLRICVRLMTWLFWDFHTIRWILTILYSRQAFLVPSSRHRRITYSRISAYLYHFALLTMWPRKGLFRIWAWLLIQAVQRLLRPALSFRLAVCQLQSQLGQTQEELGCIHECTTRQKDLGRLCAYLVGNETTAYCLQVDSPSSERRNGSGWANDLLKQTNSQ